MFLESVNCISEWKQLNGQSHSLYCLGLFFHTTEIETINILNGLQLVLVLITFSFILRAKLLMDKEIYCQSHFNIAIEKICITYQQVIKNILKN